MMWHEFRLIVASINDFQQGTVTQAGDSFKKKEKAEEARYFNKLQAEQLEKMKKAEAEKKNEKKE